MKLSPWCLGSCWNAAVGSEGSPSGPPAVCFCARKTVVDPPIGSNNLFERLLKLYPVRPRFRSEEHTSELQSLMRISYAVFCLKKNTSHPTNTPIYTNVHITNI